MKLLVAETPARVEGERDDDFCSVGAASETLGKIHENFNEYRTFCTIF